ncbi:Hpt domain-containing protein [Pokkaliibacter sp. CJK22405]|uniref:Hpt domain-containing protein n=1 Tax=Pokkaliibacter sp. CJK22405 TaxID=3384615 RepID=UPI0039855514
MSLDLVLLAELQDVMEEEFASLLVTYIDDSTQRLSRLKGALQAEDAEDARQFAHSVKGSSSNIGALQLAEHLKEMEYNAGSKDWPALNDLFAQVVAEHQAVCQELRARYLVG